MDASNPPAGLNRIGHFPTVERWLVALGLGMAAPLIAGEPATDIVGMDEVVVTATRSELPLRDTPEIVQVIDRERIDALNPQTLGALMEYTTGAAVATGTGSGLPNRSTVSINGLPANYTLVLVDGVRLLTDHIHTGQNLELVSPDCVERIEIMRGAASAQYGTDAIGGVVNIVTRKAGTRPEGTVRMSTGSNATHEGSVSLLLPAGRGVKVSTFAGWERSDGVPLKLPANRVNNTGYERLNLLGRIDAAAGPSTRWYASIHWVDESMEWRGGTTDSTLTMPAVGFEHAVGRDVEVNGRLSYTRWRAALNGELNTLFEPEVHGKWRMRANQTLMAGVDAKRNDFDRVSVGRHRQDAWGAFVQHDWAPRETLAVMAALRQDKVEGVGAAFTPKLALMLVPGKRLRLRASVGRGFHAPSLQELHEEGYGHGGTAYRFGNPELEPEHSTTYTAGVELRPTEAVQLVVYGFHSELDDMIVPVYRGPWAKDPRVDVWERTNIKSATVRGIEGSVRLTLGKGLQVESGYTLTGNRDEATGRQLPYHPGASAYGKVRVQRRLGGRDVAAFAGVRAGFNRKAWNWQPARDAGRDNPDGLTTPLRDYTNLEAGLELAVAVGAIFVRAENLLGEDIENLDDAFTVMDGSPAVRVGFSWALPLGRK